MNVTLGALVQHRRICLCAEGVEQSECGHTAGVEGVQRGGGEPPRSGHVRSFFGPTSVRVMKMAVYYCEDPEPADRDSVYQTVRAVVVCRSGECVFGGSGGWSEEPVGCLA